MRLLSRLFDLIPGEPRAPMSSLQSQITAYWVSTLLSGHRSVGPVQKHDVWRAKMDQTMRRLSKLPKDARTIPAQIGNRPGQWVEMPESRPRRVIYYLHGGGYVAGSLETHEGFVARLCQASRASGVMLDYRLAPEHPYPAALEDALNGFHWLMSNGLQPEEIVVAGDGAGGSLAIALLMALREHDDYLPAAGLVFSPWTDLAMTGWTIHGNARKDPIINLPTLSYCAQLYLKGIPPTDALASPYYGSYKGLPPLMVQASSGEALYDDAQTMARFAREAGVDVTFETLETPLHTAAFFAGVPEGEFALERAALYVCQMTDGEDLLAETEQDVTAA